MYMYIMEFLKSVSNCPEYNGNFFDSRWPVVLFMSHPVYSLYNPDTGDECCC